VFQLLCFRPCIPNRFTDILLHSTYFPVYVCIFIGYVLSAVLDVLIWKLELLFMVMFLCYFFAVMCQT